jgi:phosphoenolpyruvate carboxykinase (ATP)
MSNIMGIPSNYGIENHGLRNLNMEYWTLTTPTLVERVVSRREGILAHEGAVIVRTGTHTGRAPNDKFIVEDAETTSKVWWGKINQPYSPECFDRLYQRMLAYFQGRDIFIQDTTAAHHPQYRLPIRVITENAWHSLFTRDLFIRIPPEEQPSHVPEFTVLQAPSFHAIPEVDCTNSDAFIIISFSRKMVLIGGTGYAGEIKKSVFSVLNYLLPQKSVLSMHCSANVGQQGDVALFFGLSGTGKTTLSSDPDRLLIGDDEHGWGDDGVFNFEGGCYAKTIRLNRELEPLIWQATHHFGAILENVNINANTRRIDFDDDSLTENTRGAYPIGFLKNSIPEGRAGHPQTIIFLTADASGIMPPISRLTPEQAMYHFLSGYTSKLAGTEAGLGSEPQATFSACFGAPFLPLHPKVYAELLGKKIRQQNAQVWLVNTGWTGGPFGVGKRIHLPYTRAMVSADPIFQFMVPETCPQVPQEILNPRNTWSDPERYDAKAQQLGESFRKNFTQYKGDVSSEIMSAGPH